MLLQKQALLIKEEATYGVDAMPVPATDAVTCSNIGYNLITDTENFEFTNAGYMGQRSGGSRNYIFGATITFTTLIRGEGSTIAVAPEIGKLFKASNNDEVITPVTDVQYNPNSKFFSEDSASSLSIYYYQDKILHKILGARGNPTFTGVAGRAGVINWSFSGLYESAVADTTPDFDVNKLIPPVIANANFTIGGESICIQNFSYTFGNQVVQRDCANSATNGVKEFGITGRVPIFTCDPETPILTTKDFWAAFENSSEDAITITVGQTSLNKMTLSMPLNMYNAAPEYGERNGILIQNLSLEGKFDSGNDEWNILFD